MSRSSVCVALSGLLFTAPAMAEPVYLECTIDGGSAGTKPWSISLDENAKTFTFSHELASGTDPAIFTPDEVIVKTGSSMLRTTKRLSRVTGAFSITMEVGENDRTPLIRRGQCKKAAPKKRAF